MYLKSPDIKIVAILRKKAKRKTRSNLMGLTGTNLVPETGLEPVRCFHRGILSPLRLPISPLRRYLEAPPRFGLGIRVLQTRALPLGYGAARRAKSP